MIGIVSCLVFLGMSMLGASLWAVRDVLRQLAPGPVRRCWVWLGSMIVGFIVGYGWFLALRMGGALTQLDLLVAVILAGGGGFVLSVSRLSASTARDVGRVTLLERAVTLDPLTGLYNRRYLDARVEEELARARRTGLPLAAMMIDIDHFKRVNDVFGHAVGDMVLRRTCALLAGIARPSDTVARYGGEEMFILAPLSSRAEAYHFCERLRAQIAAESVELAGGEQVRVTASIGLASLGEQDTPQTLIERADAALYIAKRCGRNRVCTEMDLLAVAA